MKPQVDLLYINLIVNKVKMINKKIFFFFFLENKKKIIIILLSIQERSIFENRVKIE